MICESICISMRVNFNSMRVNVYQHMSKKRVLDRPSPAIICFVSYRTAVPQSQRIVHKATVVTAICLLPKTLRGVASL